jgi:hypothetical protein
MVRDCLLFDSSHPRLNALSPADFCLWAPNVPGKTVGEIEGEMIAWCSQPGHGTRIFPSGTITGVQLTKTPDYVQVVGFMDQTKVDMVQGDSGGEMDPHGADLVSLIWRMMAQSWFSPLMIRLVLARKSHGRCGLFECVGWDLQAGD